MSSDGKENRGYVLCVPQESVILERDLGPCSLIDTETGIVFHVKGGYDLFVQPRMASLYGHLRHIIDDFDESKNWEENSREIFDLTVSATLAVLEAPLFMANRDKSLFTIANVALAELKELSDEALNADLKPETPQENGDFERIMDAFGVIEESQTPAS